MESNAIKMLSIFGKLGAKAFSSYAVNFGQNELVSIGQGLGNNLITDVAQIYGYKLGHRLWASWFDDKRSIVSLILGGILS